MQKSLANKYLNMAQEAFQRNNLKLAKECFDDIIKLDEIENTLHLGVIPYFGLSLIYATFEEWAKCESITERGLEIDPNNTTLLNHMGVAICSQSKSRISKGLFYFEKGFNLGDRTNCGGNYVFWKNQIEK